MVPARSCNCGSRLPRNAVDVHSLRQLHQCLDFLREIRGSIGLVEEIEILERSFVIEVAGRQEDLDLWMLTLNEAGKINAAEFSRHADIGQDKVYLLASLQKSSSF